jgi:hypothetical protein
MDQNADRERARRLPNSVSRYRELEQVPPPSFPSRIDRRRRFERTSILLLIPSTGAERGSIQDYPASSVKREMSHQMNRKHTTKVDPSRAVDFKRLLAAPSAGRGSPAAPNQAWRERQS